MKRFLFSRAARADLEEIWDYTAKRWSVDQAEHYIRDIVSACEALAEGTRRGRAIDEIRRGYHKLAVGSHFLFYRMMEDGAVDIVRILHKRMDVPERLQ